MVADFNERKAEILAKSQAKATALGGVADIEESLFEEVTSFGGISKCFSSKI